jgi:hypothetical protein
MAMRRFLAVAAFACIAAFWGTASSAQGIPQGTYQQTCNNVSVSGDTLIANCQDANGTWRTTQLPGFQSCTSEISNDNGNLRCANAGYGPAQTWRGNGPGGSYLQTCRDVKVGGDDLHARCQTTDGAWHDAKLDDYRKCKGDIMNDNGKLRCVAGAPVGAYGPGGYGGGYPGGYNQNVNGPAGSYGQTCRDIHVGGDDLHARCQTRNGDWADTKLDDFKKCHGDIINDDGHLRCVAGAPVGGGYYGNAPYNNADNGGYYGGPNAAVNGPAGSYTRTCMDINVKGDDLHAHCQTSSGQVHDTKLDDYRKCHSDIINDDGNLRCQK